MPGLSGVIMMKKISTLFAALLLAVTVFGAAAVPASAQSKKASASERVSQPVNLAVLIQDDLVSRVGNELRVTADFIRSGSLQVRQPFTNDLAAAAGALRIPVGSTSASPYNPYVQVRDAIKLFPAGGENRNALLLVSDGLDTSRGFDYSSSVDSIDLNRASNETGGRAFFQGSDFVTFNAYFSRLAKTLNEQGGRAY